MATQEVTEFQFSDDEESLINKDTSWGQLLPLGMHFCAIDLVKEKYVFGRGDNCDYCFGNFGQLKNHPSFLSYSNNHFILTREKTSTGTFTFLEDISSNGTFINGVKVGKFKKQVLNNNDEISFLHKKNKDGDQFPTELTENYTISKMIGRGACGEVRLAFTKGTCRAVAVKIVSKKKFSVKNGRKQNQIPNNVMNEVQVMKDLKHPCIIKVEEVIDTPDTLYIVLEYMKGGELFDRVVTEGKLEEASAKVLFYQMVVAVKYLHEQGITHRDLKPENVLLSSEERETVVKVTDFGLSKFVDANTMLKTFCGTPTYLAPEILLTVGSGKYTKAIDCWSLGVILFICLAGYPPFSDEYKDMPLPQQIVKGRYSFPREHWKGVSETAIDLIKKFLKVDPEKRITLEQALNHDWLKDEDTIAKAQRLMYPVSVNMLPPHNQKKRSHQSSSGENSNDETIVNGGENPSSKRSKFPSMA
ncbi:serine/threonine-protein kinase Chk2-like isoform X2 [Tachypleus tridentatus]|uniref:serine/threonine-protein kinase Chk2-like isoform X2 n=1 Tax=Tachypleus tridentatus TaxID=6853 RepID=UPI003FD039A8